MTTDTNKKSWIQKTDGVCGGEACVRDTRITVWGLVLSRKMGTSEKRMLENTVGLTPDDLETAWEYYQRNTAEIDEAIRRNEQP